MLGCLWCCLEGHIIPAPNSPGAFVRDLETLYKPPFSQRCSDTDVLKCIQFVL